MGLLSSSGAAQRRIIVLFFMILALLLYPAWNVLAEFKDTLREQSLEDDGFVSVGFSDDQEDVIVDAVAAFDAALGGRGELKSIIHAYNQGNPWTITYDPDRVGANSAIKLGVTVFSCERASAENYSLYGTRNEARHAQIVIGHEISHLLIRAVLAETGVDWSKAYEERVPRNWQRMNDPKAPLEEAVTELSLSVLESGYYIYLFEDELEDNPEMLSKIDAWVKDFLDALRGMR